MQKLALLTILLLLGAALPLAAQQQGQQQEGQQGQQGQQQQGQQPPKPPILEDPGTAAPEEKPAPTKPKAAAPAKLKPAPVASNPESSRTVEEIVARVNNEIITRTELDKSRNSAEEDAKQECQGRCNAEQLQTAIADRQKYALRDLIDQSLLVQRGKDMGVSVEPEVIKQLDQIRIQNKIDSMEDLEKAVSSQGLNWEDFKNNIRNRILQQRVISSEVGSHISIGNDEVQKYYDEHKSEFIRPEQVALRSIEVNTEGKKPEEVAKLREKADTALKRVKDGEDFGEIAKRFSDGSTAKEGGYLGIYKRGELSKELEDRVFQMKKNELTDVIETKQGFLILQVMEHYTEGQQTVEKVHDEIMDRLYSERMEPALRDYLKTLREQSYVIVKPGYQDMAGGNSEIQEVSATPEAQKAKKSGGHKKYLLFGKRSGQDTKSSL
jgi:peptidyl-prolyl cis-trans isomerase SurA